MNFNVLLWLELAKKFVVGGWLGVVVFKTIIVFSLAEAEQYQNFPITSKEFQFNKGALQNQKQVKLGTLSQPFDPPPSPP